MLMRDQPDEANKLQNYWSQTLSTAEKNDDASRRECLAAFWAMLCSSPCLEGQKFTICPEHGALHWVLKLAYSTGLLAR